MQTIRSIIAPSPRTASAPDDRVAVGAAEAESDVAALSRREIECLEWLARGLQDAQTADRLGLSRSTVRLHLANARRKLNARTREQALVCALLKQLIAP